MRTVDGAQLLSRLVGRPRRAGAVPRFVASERQQKLRREALGNEERRARLEHVLTRLGHAYEGVPEAPGRWSRGGMGATPFRAVVSAMLAMEAYDTRIVPACTAIFAEASCFEQVLAMSDERLLELVRPLAGQGRTLVTRLKDTSRLILSEYGGRVPERQEELRLLPGVGEMRARWLSREKLGGRSMLQETHVRRVLCRLGILERRRSSARVVEAGQERLVRTLTPELVKRDAQRLLIVHGTRVCFSVYAPQCLQCKVAHLCEYYATWGVRRKNWPGSAVLPPEAAPTKPL